MRYLYCPHCDQLMPKSWFSWKRCRTCGEEAVVIRVKMSVFGMLAYAFDALALVLIMAKLMAIDIGLGGNDIYAIFGIVGVGLVCQFIEVSKAQKVVEQRISEHYPKHRRAQ